MRLPLAPDWPAVIDQLVATGLSHDDIAQRSQLSLKGLRYLRDGIRQPLFYRGEALLIVWCERTGNPRADIPTCQVVRGHRKAREAMDRSPKLQSLPDWPPPVQLTVMQGKKRRKKEPA